jgi:hypothetical protein
MTKKSKIEENLKEEELLAQLISLSDNILSTLKLNPNGLSDRKLVSILRKFIQGELLKVAKSSRKIKESNKIVELVSTSKFLTLVRSKLYDMVENGRIVKQAAQYRLKETSDYELLRAAIVDFARIKGIPDADDFPDVLIYRHRELAQAQSQFCSFFEK